MARPTPNFPPSVRAAWQAANAAVVAAEKAGDLASLWEAVARRRTVEAQAVSVTGDLRVAR